MLVCLGQERAAFSPAQACACWFASDSDRRAGNGHHYPLRQFCRTSWKPPRKLRAVSRLPKAAATFPALIRQCIETKSWLFEHFNSTSQNALSVLCAEIFKSARLAPFLLACKVPECVFWTHFSALPRHVPQVADVKEKGRCRGSVDLGGKQLFVFDKREPEGLVSPLLTFRLPFPPLASTQLSCLFGTHEVWLL